MKKKIEDYEDYWVDTDGNVWSSKSGKMKILRSAKNRDGYLRVVLCKNISRKNISVHRLVALAFLPNPNNYPQVNHKNGIKSDNRLENLEWCSSYQNIIHAMNNGLRNLKGSKHNLAKLKESDIPIIHQRLANGEKGTVIAKDYDVTKYTISDIKRGKTWTHIPRTPKK